MAPDKKKPTDIDEVIIQTYLNSFKNNSVEETETTNTEMNVVGHDKAEADVATFVDNERRYYYQPAGDTQNFAALAVAENTEKMRQEDAHMLLGGKEFHTVPLVPTETGECKLSYVSVVQEETKTVVNINKEVEQQQDKVNNVITFNEKDATIEKKEKPQRKSKKDNSQKIIIENNKKVKPKLTCKICTYTCQKRSTLQRHMTNHDERPYKCSICEHTFKTHVSLQNHVNVHNGVKPYVCEYCNSPFTTPGVLARHVRYKHTFEKPHKCNECDYATVELCKLRRHRLNHTGERPYHCPHCTYASIDTFKLKRHMRIHTGEKPYECDECNMRFTQSTSLKSHKLRHSMTDKPVFSCELCPATCSRKADLRIHVQSLHFSDKPLECKRCGETFPDRYTWKMHNKTHEGEKCYKCDFCSYTSTALRHLHSHMLIHSGEKAFSCD
ncbi:uncharacterized protein [Epargyreus clarus]|uniref:uncharacterized protein n=1 Tax=Epargyreus clarus TaxID=520877 RepID=UPI003C2F6F5F